MWRDASWRTYPSIMAGTQQDQTVLYSMPSGRSLDQSYRYMPWAWTWNKYQPLEKKHDSVGERKLNHKCRGIGEYIYTHLQALKTKPLRCTESQDSLLRSTRWEKGRGAADCWRGGVERLLGWSGRHGAWGPGDCVRWVVGPGGFGWRVGWLSCLPLGAGRGMELLAGAVPSWMGRLGLQVGFAACMDRLVITFIYIPKESIYIWGTKPDKTFCLT